MQHAYFRGLDILWRFSAILNKGNDFNNLVFSLRIANPLLKRGLPKRKEFAALLLEYTPFRKLGTKHVDTVVSFEIHLL